MNMSQNEDRPETTSSEQPLASVPLRVITSPAMPREAVVTMKKHGCVFERREADLIITFPPGTTRTEIWPRVWSERYTLCLPDGYCVRQVVMRSERQSLICYTPE
ncbi:MAG: hypothetical protein WCD86_01635 [Ktedonobacteraceae bacterium]